MTLQAFTWDDGAVENAMTDRFRASPEFRADWSLVAVLGGVIVGHVLVAPCELQGDNVQRDAANQPRRALMLGPMSVVPEHQCQGIGSALMRDVLGRVQGSGEALVVLWGHPEFYPRFGFRPASEFGLLPNTPEAMVCPLQADLSVYTGLSLPH